MPVFDEAQKVSVEKKACKCGAQLIRVEYKEVTYMNPLIISTLIFTPKYTEIIRLLNGHF